MLNFCLNEKDLIFRFSDLQLSQLEMKKIIELQSESLSTMYNIFNKILIY